MIDSVSSPPAPGPAQAPEPAQAPGPAEAPAPARVPEPARAPVRPLARPHLIALGAAIVALATVVGVTQPSLTPAVLRALLIAVLVPCAVIDLRTRLIPNRITGPAALLAIALGTALDPGGEPTRLIWAALVGGFLLLAAIAYPAGMGMGDVKLIGVMGLLLGPAVLVALMAALLAQIAYAIGLSARHGFTRARKATLPFGPFLAGGGLLAALAGDALLRTYLSLHG